MPDDLRVEPLRRERLSQQIALEICRMIRRGQVKPGQTLPAERDLAAQLGVSRTSLREALRGLEIAGIIDSRHGGGTFVRDFSEFGIESPLSMVLEATQEIVADLWEVRRIVEPEIAARAALRSTAEDHEQLQEIVRQQQAEFLTDEIRRTGGKPLDRELHTAIATASKNKVAVQVVQLIYRLLYQDNDPFAVSRKRREVAFNHHVDIVNAIVGRNAEDARQHMRRHLTEVEETILGEMIDERGRESGKTAERANSVGLGNEDN